VNIGQEDAEQDGSDSGEEDGVQQDGRWNTFHRIQVCLGTRDEHYFEFIAGAQYFPCALLDVEVCRSDGGGATADPDGVVGWLDELPTLVIEERELIETEIEAHLS